MNISASVINEYLNNKLSFDTFYYDTAAQFKVKIFNILKEGFPLEFSDLTSADYISIWRASYRCVVIQVGPYSPRMVLVVGVKPDDGKGIQSCLQEKSYSF